MVAFVLSLALALLPHSTAHKTATNHSTGRFPTRGIVIPGVSFAGIHLGDTMAKVKTTWGGNYTLCNFCDDQTWLYEYGFGEPLGAAVRFQKGKVVAIFNLGSPAGWKTNNGLNMGDPISNVYTPYPTMTTTRCIGFDSLSVKVGNSVIAFYSAAGVIYGFAMMTPTQTVCQ